MVFSQSNGDIYCIIDPDSPGYYSSGSGEYEWVQFEFQELISVVLFKIKSAHHGDWNETILYKKKDDQTLNGEITFNFKAIEAKRFRIEKFRENWVGTNFMLIKNFEFYSDDP